MRFGFHAACNDMVLTHRPLSSSFLGLPYRILNINRYYLGAYGYIPEGFETLNPKPRVSSGRVGQVSAAPVTISQKRLVKLSKLRL